MKELLQNEAELDLSHFGPATVQSVEGQRVLVTLGKAKAWATLAMPHGYQPVAGDVLLVLGRAGSFYAIGVISGRGRTVMTSHGDLELRAPNGNITLAARDGIVARSSVIRMVADTWEMAVDTLRQRCRRLLTQVSEVLRLRGRRVDVAATKSYRLTADRITQRAATDVHIDGEKIHLG